MLRNLTSLYWTLMAALFAPALALAQTTAEPTRPPTVPGLGWLMLLGVVFLGGLWLIFFKRYTSDRHRRGQG
jgi:drug/metabolite transporter (DMT)-like permease